MSYKHLTQEERQEILDLYSRLKHTTLVVEETGHSYGKVRHTLKCAGVKTPGGRVGACRRNHDLIVEACAAGRSLSSIAREVGTNSTSLRRHIEREAIRVVPFRQAGPNNPAWKGGRMVDKSGYVLIWKPEHPQSNRHGYCREHRLVMEEKLGRYMTRLEVVDHIDGVTGNNDPSNLRLFATNADHLRATLTGVKCPQRGRPGVPRPRKSKKALPSHDGLETGD